MISADDIHFSYSDSGDTPALLGVSFQLKEGERVALMGANGSGKTTLIRCLNGLIIPSRGQVTVDGYSTAVNETIYEVRRRVGMMFQNPDNQIVSTTVEREIAFGLENLGVSWEEMKIKVQTALWKFRLLDYRATPPHLLSGGERQRLALASVWVMQPNYLILDEPTSLLDPHSRREVLELLDREMGGRNLGMLIVTQIPEESLLCDRVIIMDKGKIVLSGEPEEIYRQPEKIRKLGLGIPVSIELSGLLN